MSIRTQNMLIGLMQKISWLIMQRLNCCVFKFELINAKHLNKLEIGPKKALIIALNHKSLWDHFFLGAALKFNSPLWPLRFIAADWLFSNPFWRLPTQMLGGFPARKGQGMKTSLQIPLDILKNSGTVVIYPEGKIIKENNLIGEPKRGIGALALWSKAPILPIAIKGSRGLRQRKNVKLIFGEPFYIQDILPARNPTLTEQDLNQAKQIIMDKIKSLYFSH